ncbi:hypothetical protein ACFUTY_24950 [Streptomyces sp. NPDC057362]|uniref:hypothetical protein n=1 Tax=Streptomyces sp. NPDC057362 TaxID=3346106 RepID=UPI00362982FF
MDRARRHFGSLDLLFLNAGISRPGPMESTDEDTFDALRSVDRTCRRSSRARRRRCGVRGNRLGAKGEGLVKAQAFEHRPLDERSPDDRRTRRRHRQRTCRCRE